MYQFATINNHNLLNARAIHEVFQQSYRVEKDILSLEHFPPLDRTVDDILCSKTLFYGISLVEISSETPNPFCGICELSRNNEKSISIDSFTVCPDYFRRSVGTALMQFVIQLYYQETIHVSTATDNVPAVNFYNKNGFIIDSHDNTSCGLQLVKMKRIPTNCDHPR
ncbi:GNAT family N-acetyltransferase [Myxococcota bacterium]|nr:GNAT family N-acetyltransferase [Myxococcota bacterium]MBU1381304.1 GNAT family N-acetyltransferase [Myxococcota bacterium]MBU1498349.1 GNAT family N-acetyltransferase [Myxococcota bacterium]